MEGIFKNKYRIESIRLKDWDYSDEGYYFVTICTKDREHYFGEIFNDQMILNEIGEIAYECWYEIPKHFPFVQLDEFIVMPNHVHGIIIIDHENQCETNPSTVETKNLLSLPECKTVTHGTSKTIGSIIRGLKIGVTKWINDNTNLKNIWQSNYYDRIIRDEKELFNVRKYIQDNPLKWNEDINNLNKY